MIKHIFLFDKPVVANWLLSEPKPRIHREIHRFIEVKAAIESGMVNPGVRNNKFIGALISIDTFDSVFY